MLRCFIFIIYQLELVMNSIVMKNRMEWNGNRNGNNDNDEEEDGEICDVRNDHSGMMITTMVIVTTITLTMT